MNMENIEFPEAEVKMLEARSLHGDKARQVRDGQDWKWLQEFIFGALFDEAVETLRKARTDEDRVKAQQMFLACEKPKRQLEFLISQGDAAVASLKEISGQNEPTLDNQEAQHA